MPRFFFDLEAAGSDDLGVELRDEQAARKEALDAVVAMMADNAPGRNRRLRMTVRGPDGKPLFSVSGRVDIVEAQPNAASFPACN